MLVTGVRDSDWLTREHSDFVGVLPVAIERHVGDVLDENEWNRLPEYLVALGIDVTREAAEASIKSVQSRTARDTLSMLYWLLPQTRSSIIRSVKDEYFRLGDEAGLTRVLIGEVKRSSKVLREAYEMIAVGESFRHRFRWRYLFRHSASIMAIGRTALRLPVQPGGYCTMRSRTMRKASFIVREIRLSLILLCEP